MRVRNGTAARSLLQVATEVLVADPSASLADVAAAAGIGRTTLHAAYPTRHALLVAIANDALDQLESIYAAAGLDAGGDQAATVLRGLVTQLVPLGPGMMFLTRERSLDTEPALLARLDALDDALQQLVGQGQTAGVFRADLPDVWVVGSINALVYSAWELISIGRLAPADGPALVMESLLHGIAARPDGPRR